MFDEILLHAQDYFKLSLKLARDERTPKYFLENLFNMYFEIGQFFHVNVYLFLEFHLQLQHLLVIL